MSDEMRQSRKATVTDENKAEATKLKALWEQRSHRLSQAEFGELYEIGNQSAVGQFLRGVVPLSLKAAIGFARGLNCSIQDFSPRLADAARKISISVTIPSDEEIDLDEILATLQLDSKQKLDVERSGNRKLDNLVLHHYETGGSMGRGIVLKDQPGSINSWNVSREWLQKNVPHCTNPRNLAIVTGFGDSMRPLYNPGDPLLIDTGVKSVEFEGIYFFRVENEGFVKRIQRVPGEGLIAISDNKAYRDWVIKPGLDFEVFGRVIKVWRSDDF